MLEKNLKALAARFPQYVEPIRNAKLGGRYSVTNGNLVDMKAGAAYYPPKIDQFVVDDLTKSIKLANLTFFFGLGLGYHLRIILQKPADAIIVFEPDFELIKTAFSSVDLTRVIANSAVVFCFGNPAAFHPLLFQAFQQGQAKYFLKAANFIPVGLSYSLNKEYYSVCIEKIKDATKAILAFYGNDPKDSLIGIHHTFINIDEIIEHPGIKDLKDAFKNKVGIVVATGPSLDKNIDLLHEVGDRAVVVAADASLKVMLRRGLKPHIVTALERVIATAKLFEGLTEEEVQDVYFAPCPVIHPDTYKNWPGKKIVVYRDFATFKWLDIEKGQLTIGPSSANMAYKLLEYMGCNRIILIGQDLAYIGDLTHAEGTTYGVKQAAMGKFGTIMVAGNYEPQVRTIGAWNSFRQFYEADIQRYKGEVINATEGGAKIHGAKIMSFREAIDSYIEPKSLNVVSLIEKRLSVPPLARQQKLRKDVLAKVDAALVFCEQALKNFTEGVEDSKLLIAEKSNDALKKVERHMAIYNEHDFYLIMMHYVQSYFIKTIIEINHIRAATLKSEEYFAKFGEVNLALNSTMLGLTNAMKEEFMHMKQHLENRDKA